MGKIPSKPVVTNQPWINGVTKLNHRNLTNGINQNISNIKTAVDGIIDALGGPGGESASDKTLDQSSITAYNPETTYSQGQVVIYNDKYYRAKENDVTGAWNAEKWSQIALSTPVDSALNPDSTNPVQNKVVTEELDTKAVLGAFNGGGTGVDYADNANNLIATKGLEVESYFTFEKTGGAQSSAIETGNGTLKNLYGKTEKSENLLVLNDVTDTTSSGVTYSVSNGVVKMSGTWTSNTGIPIVSKNVTLPAGTYTLWSRFTSINNSPKVQIYSSVASGNTRLAEIDPSSSATPSATFTLASQDTVSFRVCPIKGKALPIGFEVRPMIVQGPTAPTEWKQGYAGLKHTNITGLKSTNINLFNEEMILGTLDITTGNVISISDRLVSKDFIEVLPNQDIYIRRGETATNMRLCYYDINHNFIKGEADGAPMNRAYRTPRLCRYIKFGLQSPYGTTYRHDITINFSDATINGRYYPFEQDTLSIAFEGNGIGTTHDELDVENGKKITRFDSYDMGLLSFVYHPAGGSYDDFFDAYLPQTFKNGINGVSNIICAEYETVENYNIATHNDEYNDGVIALAQNSTRLIICDKRFTSASDLKTYLNGRMLCAELATPTTTDVTIPKDTIKVWNGGSMEALGTEVPVGTKIFYQKNLKNFIEGLGEATNWDPESITDAILDVAGDIAPEYSASQTYSKGDLVIHERVLYKANQDIATAEAWNSAHWTRTTVAEAAPENFEEITWEDLKSLRNAGRLVPGKQYRITDYLTVVEQPECRSAGHRFDIIVTALTSNILSENTKAVASEGDIYFSSKPVIVSAAWKSGVVLSDIETLYKMADGDSPYTTPVEKERVFTQMGTMVNPATGIEVPYLFEPDPEGEGEPSDHDRRYLFTGEYKFNGVVYDLWEECYVNGTSVSPDTGTAYYELTNVVVDCEQSIFEKVKLSAWKLKYCLDNDYDRFGFAVRHDVIRVYDRGMTYLYLRYPSLDGDDGLVWAYVVNSEHQFIDAPSVDYNDLDTSNVIYTPNLSINIGDELSMDGHQVTVGATRIGKGVIYEMEDEWGNKLPYDFKNVQFKRYKVTNNTSAYDGFDGKYVGCKNIRGRMVSPQGYTIEDDTDFSWCYTFNWYNENGGSEDYSIVGNISLYNDAGFISGCYNNIFGICTEPVFGQVSEVPRNRIYLGNNVIYDKYDPIEGHSYGFYSNTIGDNFYFNTIGNDFNFNTVGNYFNSNTIGTEFHSNLVGEYFAYNTVGDAFRHNIVGNTFSSNTLGNSCYYNTVGNNFTYNILGNNFRTNIVGNDFKNNTVEGSFMTNIVGNKFSDNTVKSLFQFNTVGNNFSYNTVNEDFRYNTVGNSFYDNTVGKFTEYSSIKESVSHVALDAPSGSSNNRLKYITIGPGIHGASSSNRLAITPIRNVNYEQEYVNEDKVVNQVSVS